MIKVKQQQGAGAHVACEPPCLLNTGENQRSAPPHGELMPPQAQGCSLCPADNHFILPAFVYSRLVQGPVHKMNMHSANNSNST